MSQKEIVKDKIKKNEMSLKKNIKYNQTIEFKNKPVIKGNYSVVGPKEGQGHFGKFFHYVMEDDLFNQKTYEKAEKKMVEKTLLGAIHSAGLKPEEHRFIFSRGLVKSNNKF